MGVRGPLCSLVTSFKSTSMDMASHELSVVFVLQECAVAFTSNAPTLSLSASFPELLLKDRTTEVQLTLHTVTLVLLVNHISSP